MLYCQLKLPGIINPDVMDILALLVFEKHFETFWFFDNQAFVVAYVVSHLLYSSRFATSRPCPGNRIERKEASLLGPTKS